jgi:hypothetical protein
MKKSRIAILSLLTIAGFVPAAHAENSGCVNGVMEIDGENGDYDVRSYCETVIISGTNNRVSMGNVGKLEIGGTNIEVQAGNIENLDLAGTNNILTAGNVRSGEVAGSNNRSKAMVISNIEVWGGNNVIGADRILAIEIGGSDNRATFRFLNPNPRNPKKPTRPAAQVVGSNNSIIWDKAAR